MILYMVMILFGSVLYGNDLDTIQQEWTQVQRAIACISTPEDKEKLYILYAGATSPEPCHMQAIIDHLKIALEKNHHKLSSDEEARNLTESLKNLEDFVTNKAPREQETLQQFFNKITLTYIPRDVYISGLLRVDSNVSIGGDLTVTGSITNGPLANVVSNNGPSQDNALARFDGTSGKLIQNSALIGSDFTTATQNNVAISADDGTTTNITLALVPKGTGALSTAIPDGTATGGNARGANSVDLQTIRTTPMDVASGAYATIPGGNNNRSSGDYSFSAGRRAKSDDLGSFTWADSTDADFTSNGINTFNVRANGGAFIHGDLFVTGSLIASNVTTGSSTGNVSNFGTSQDKAIARFNGTTGRIIQNSALIATDFTVLTQNNVAIKADDGSTADIDLALVPKGTGALTVAIPDGTAVGGIARGANAVDLQITRIAAGQVASGTQSALIGGNENTASGTASIVAGGEVGVASAQDAAVLGGNTNTASGITAVAVGGISNTASGNFSFAAGSNAKAANQGSFVWADSIGVDFTSHGQDTFNVRATGGIFLNGDLTVTGSITATPSLVQSSGASLDKAIARFNGTSGTIIQNSALIATDFTAVTQANVAIKADDGSTTNITLALVPKGTGALTTTIPDGGTAGGNARGQNAVDLQISRTNNGQVAAANLSTLSGGSGNLISSASLGAVIAGGSNHNIFNTATFSTISGGFINQIDNSTNSAIAGGTNNLIQAASGSSFIAGGNNNTITSSSFAFAAGRRAKANQQGVFIWADSTNADFNSSTQDTFNVRATNGGFFSNNLKFNNSAALPLNVTGGEETALRIIRGSVIAGGADSGTGWTSSSPGTGSTQINWNTAFSTAPSIVVLPTTDGSTSYVPNIVIQATGSVTIQIRNLAGTLTNRNFDFIAIGN